MKKLLLILICSFLSFQSHGWEPIGTTGGGENSFYIDKIKRSGDQVYFWSLANNTDGTSDMMRFRVECFSEKMRVVKFLQFSNKWGKGKRLHEGGGDGRDQYPPPGSILEKYYNFVCSN